MKKSSLFKAVFVFLLLAASCSVQTPLISLDAASAGATWKNTGPLGGAFTRGGNPKLETVGGVQVVTFDGQHDWFRVPEAPAALLGHAPRTTIGGTWAVGTTRSMAWKGIAPDCPL